MRSGEMYFAAFATFCIGVAVTLLLVSSGFVRFGPKVERVVVLPPMTETGYTVHFTLTPYNPPIGTYQVDK